MKPLTSHSPLRGAASAAVLALLLVGAAGPAASRPVLGASRPVLGASRPVHGASRPVHGASRAQPAPADSDAAYGARLFRVYCQSCHGEHGRGDGPVARELRLELPDLRRLVQRADDGRFPSERVTAVIDGREPTAGHGTREMPVWGLTFRDSGLVAERESDVEERVRSLVAYLRSLQESTQSRP